MSVKRSNNHSRLHFCSEYEQKNSAPRAVERSGYVVRFVLRQKTINQSPQKGGAKMNTVVESRHVSAGSDNPDQNPIALAMRERGYENARVFPDRVTWDDDSGDNVAYWTEEIKTVLDEYSATGQMVTPRDITL